MSYTRYPFRGRRKANVADEFEPTPFCAVETASVKGILTSEDRAFFIVESSGIVPVKLIGFTTFFRVVPFGAAELVFELLLLTCANASELMTATSIPMANAVAAPITNVFFVP